MIINLDNVKTLKFYKNFIKNCLYYVYKILNIIEFFLKLMYNICIKRR